MTALAVDGTANKASDQSVSGHGTNDANVDSLNVTCLRERLEVAGLDVDGSREMLVNRLKAHASSK